MHPPLARFFISFRLGLQFTAPLLAASLAGCASVSVRPLSDAVGTDAKHAVRPKRIVIETFSIPEPGRIRADRKEGALAAFDAKLQVELRSHLVSELRKLGLAVEAAEPAKIMQPSKSEAAWVVKGQFRRVNQGSRALRLLIGLGAGGSKMETAVQVFDRSTPSVRPIIVFETTGGSNAEPGLIGAGGPVSGGVGIAFTAANAVSTVLGNGGHGVTEDTRRTARVISAYLSEELADRGFLDPAKVRHAKRLSQSAKADIAAKRNSPRSPDYPPMN